MWSCCICHGLGNVDEGDGPALRPSASIKWLYCASQSSQLLKGAVPIFFARRSR